jgi:hypothetical protein
VLLAEHVPGRLAGDWSQLGKGAAFATDFQRGVVQNVDGVRSRAAESGANMDWDIETLFGGD